MVEGPLVSLIVAMTDNGVIGRDNTMPWHLPDDLKRFRALTMGKPMLMGRRTFEAIGRPLPGRTNIVLTRDAHWRAEGAVVVHSVDEALQRSGNVPELCAIGGADVFGLVMPMARRIDLTRIHADIPGDTVFPPIDPAQWREVERIEHGADERHAFPMTFVTLERIPLA